MTSDTEILQASFVRETRELLEEANDALLVLEANPADNAAINALFRAVHSIKGSAGLFDLPALIHLVHGAEDLLGTIREGAMPINSSMTDDLLAGLDLVGNWIGQFEAQGRLEPSCMSFAQDYADRYRAYLGASDADAADGAGAAMVSGRASWITDEVMAELNASLSGEMVLQPTLTAITYAPSADCFFAGEDPLFLALHTPDVLWMRIEPQAEWEDRETFDPYCCNLRFLIISAAPREDLEHRYRYVLAEANLETLHLAEEASTEEAATAEVAEDMIPLPDVAREILEAQRRNLAEDGKGRSKAALARTVRNVLLATGHSALPASDEQDPAAIAKALDIMLATRKQAAIKSEAAVPEMPQKTAGHEASPEKTLRVEQGKVDLMMNLVGELIVAKNALPFLAHDAEAKYGSRELSREIKEKYAVIDRISQEMQGAIMGIRMLPVSELFRRFPRLVRDVSRKLHKNVQLQIEGEATRADKNVIEALSEPLTHIIRNSLDHGIELPADRIEVGKAETATIRLRAFQEGDNVVIEVHDDGRGIDPAKVRAKAIAKQLIDADRAAQLSDAEAVQLVFLPGFSTAEQVSDLSGRGVGMDAVRTVAERQGGTVQLESVKGGGTIVRLRLPLSMAVTRVLTIKVGDQLYGVPMDLVVETVRIPADNLRRMKSAEAIIMRDTVIPVLRLRDQLGLSARRAEQESMLILRTEGVTIGLVVDDFGTGMDIILKPFAGILAGVSGFAGSAVLGDGKVLLVLNLKEIL